MKKKDKAYRYPLVARIFLILAYVVPIVYMFLYLVITKRITFQQNFQVITTPGMLTYLILYGSIAVAAIERTCISMTKYNGTEQSKKRLNITWEIINFGHIGYLVFAGAMYAVIFSASAKHLGITTIHLPSYLMVYVGSILMIDMFFYIPWLQITEKWLCFLPFEKKYMALSIRLKNVLVAGFSTISMVLICLGPILYPGYENISGKALFWKISPIALSSIILVTVDFILLNASTLNNIKNFTEFAQNLAKGNYSEEQIKVISRDEFAILVNNFNDFYQNTKNLISAIQVSVDGSNISAVESKNSMEKIQSSVSHILANISTVKDQMQNQSAGVEEASAVINEIASNINVLNKNVELQSAAVEESSAAVREMVASIQSVSSILEKNNETANELGKASEEGQQKVESASELSKQILVESAGLIEASNVIQNIARQTNLLAMNAAIEAAHAGEAGQGFSVVADEIRKLAEESNVQGKKISESLKHLESSIENVSDSTVQLKSQFDKIFELSKVVLEQENVVSNAMQEQSAGSVQILQAIKNIDESTIDVRHSSESMQENSNQIIEEMKLLSDTTVKTNESINQMNQGIMIINDAVVSGNDATNKNTDSIKAITTETDKFSLQKEE